MNLVTSFEENYEVKLPTHRIVCWRCDGDGRHVNPAVDGNGISREEMDDLGEEFLEDYLSGMYDVPCEECHGRNVLDEVDEDALSPELRTQWHQWLKDDAEYWAMVAAERRMGA